MPYKCCISVDECSSSRFGFSLSHFPVAGQTRASEPTTSLLPKSPGVSIPLTKWSGPRFYLITSSHRRLPWQEKRCLQYCTVLPPGCHADSKPVETRETGRHIVPWQALFLPGLFAELSRVKLWPLGKFLGGRHGQNCACCWETSCLKLDRIRGKNNCMASSEGSELHASGTLQVLT